MWLLQGSFGGEAGALELGLCESSDLSPIRAYLVDHMYPDSSYATANGIWSQLSKVEFSLLKPARPTPPRRTDRRSGPVLALVLGLVPGGGASSGGASRPVELAFKRHLIGTRKRNRAGAPAGFRRISARGAVHSIAPVLDNGKNTEIADRMCVFPAAKTSGRVGIDWRRGRSHPLNLAAST
ncbi:uncharacterized protein VDAG_06291 [Verticillium dahliae VdLs.17]|uniref:Uncharacterized protein n=1 Tax=Verticillium dahliae (strain VdLs.17 / ATCC MYA-4575 / FGSC 10137) TaxID=498257 RepID=G2X733_VERDV|nr:uncharacterized protein VDAG_06291 [Verticillium dahliae VdLs.17]EGY14801.1 hypothetical protein VDAG_06291 [Verticillium dahliae VdLs.17]